jgi:hypothetical protein
MKSDGVSSAKRPVSVGLILRLGLIAVLALSGVGCATSNGDMASAPNHSSTSSGSVDHEANGDPLKAWWN